MKIQELFEKAQTKKGPAVKKIERDTFLYMPPQGDPDEFAQCSTCRFFIPGKERCAILGPNVHVPAEASCGLYTHGEPREDQEALAVYSPSVVGLVRRQVRCENCVSFDDGTCKLFKMLNQTKPEIFKLEDQVEAAACCNAQTPKP